MVLADGNKEIPGRDFCSVLAQAVGTDPIGTAPTYDEYFIFELRSPWRREVTETPHFPSGVNDAVQEAARRGRNVRVQCIIPDGDAADDPAVTRIMHFVRPRGALVPYEKREYIVPTGDVASVSWLLLVDDDASDSLRPFRQPTDGSRDMFICTHGARDACCGKFGAAMFEQLRAAAESASLTTRVWRVSHLGGHRFAPTLLELPYGRYWGWLSAEAVAPLVHRTGDVARLRPFYRGWGTLATLMQQVVEAEAFVRMGWDWLECEITVTSARDPETGATGDAGNAVGDVSERAYADVVMEWSHPPTGRRGHVRGSVQIARIVTVPESCGGASTDFNEYRVTEFEMTGL